MTTANDPWPDRLCLMSLFSESSNPAKGEGHWVHLRKLPGKGVALSEAEGQLQMLASACGAVISIKMLVGRGQAIICMATVSAATALIEYFQSSAAKDDESYHHLKRAIASVGKVPNGDAPELTPEIVEREVSRCISSMMNLIVGRYNVEREQEKKKLGKRKLIEIQSGQVQVQKGNRKLSSDICFEYIVTGGRCSHESGCRKIHKQGSVISLPVSYRVFETDNQFPISREMSKSKDEVNDVICKLSAHLINKKSIVLDGSSSNSAKALRLCSVQRRTKEDIIIPNYCFATFEQIRSLGG